MDLNSKIIFDRLCMRLPLITDAPAIYSNWATDSEVARYSSWKVHSSLQSTEEFIDYMLKCWEERHELTWVITLKNSDEAIGALSVRPKNHMIEIGYALGRAHWNKGYMTEVVSNMSEIFMRESSVFRVWAFCDAENIASAQVLEKSGFEKEGLLRKWALHPNISDIPRDCYSYSKTRRL